MFPIIQFCFLLSLLVLIHAPTGYSMHTNYKASNIYCIAGNFRGTYVYFAGESSIRIFANKISRMAYNEAIFQLEMMPSSEFPPTKFSLLINHPQKPRKFHTVKISGYTVYKTMRHSCLLDDKYKFVRDKDHKTINLPHSINIRMLH